MIQFSEKQIFLVTGASRGIGAATARILLEAGACVVGSYNSGAGALNDLVKEFGADRVFAVQANLAKIGEAKALWQTAKGFKGHLNGLVNNAGIMPETPLDDSDEDWHRNWADVMTVNVQAVADLCREAIRDFGEAGEGRIVTIASRASFRGDGPDFLNYAASKGAVVSLMRSIARGFADKGIYAFTIAPGWVKTDMAAVAFEPGNEGMLKEIPIGDAAPPENIGNMVAFFLSGLIDHSTGCAIDINGASYVR